MRTGLLVFSLSIPLLSFSQWGDGSLPPMLNSAQAKLHTYSLPAPSVDSLLQADSLETLAGMPYRFGYALPFSLNLDSVPFTELSEGRIKSIHIQANGATSLNLNFSLCKIPEGAKIWAVGGQPDIVKGGFTRFHISNPFHFSIEPIEGENITLIYWEPLDATEKAAIEVQEVVYGYKSWDKAEFGGSGSCNVNINCPQAQGWENEKRAVVMILTAGNTRKCTGTLVNNTAQNGIPYLLTARHCNTLSNAIFMFNYESQNCNSIDGPTYMTLQGCSLLANHPYSDFHLLQLNQTPPPEFNAYYAGWDHSNLPSPQSVTIHHPSGDIKKFSIDSNLLLTSGYLPLPDTGVNYWKVQDWDIGTTEGGSSGSPLFDTAHHVIGQLRGGLASCNNNSPDYYGKFFWSWDYGLDSASRLDYWLDPAQTGTTVLNGANFTIPFYQRDIKLIGFTGFPALDCKLNQQIGLIFLNLGADPVTEARFSFTSDGQTDTLLYTGNLNFIEQDTLWFPYNWATYGTKTLEARILDINQLPDEQIANDQKDTTAKFANGVYHQVELITDNYADETSFQIRDSLGFILYAFTGFLPNDTQTVSFCLEEGCYRFEILDSQGDGICCGNFGNGHFSLIGQNGQVIFEGGAFDFIDSVRFCSPWFNSKQALFALFPNPTSGTLHVLTDPELNGTSLEFTVLDISGKTVRNFTQIARLDNVLEFKGINTGIYFLRIRDAVSEKIWIEKFLLVDDGQQ